MQRKCRLFIGISDALPQTDKDVKGLPKIAYR
jgi:hypothetical protein